ncbi:MAG: hypothetical protein ACOCUP_02770 [bacterium]
MRIFVLVFMLVILSASSFSQEWNYARLSVLYGSNIPFNFNSIEKYRTGIEISEGTILGITLADSSQAGHDLEGFDLNMRTFNGATMIKGESSNLSLDKIQVRADNYLGLGAGFSYGYTDLSSVWTTLFSYNNPSFTNLSWDLHQLSLSYQCGVPVSAGGNGTLLGEEPDYYTIEIEIELVPTGPGF